MNLLGHTSINKTKDWKLSELIEELRAVERVLETEAIDPIFIRYRAFLFDEMREYIKNKMKGTQYEWK